MKEAIAQLKDFRERTQKETWGDRRAQDFFIGGITASINKLERVLYGEDVTE